MPKQVLPSRRFQFTLRGLLGAFALVVIAGGVAERFGPNLVWWVQSSQRPPIAALPVTVLHRKVEAHEGFARCHFGAIEFELPREMTKSVRVVGRAVQFKGKDTRVLVEVPRSTDPWVGLPDGAWRDGWDGVDFRLHFYEANSSDFRLTMSKKQLKLHKWMMINRQAMVWTSAEALRGPNTKGLLSVGDAYCHFEWSTSTKLNGEVTFWRGKDPDLEWIRRFCKTFEVTNGSCPTTRMTDAQLLDCISVE